MCDPNGQVRAGLPVPEFAFRLIDGSTVNRGDLLGSWTLIQIWATSCGPCIGEMPQLHLAHEAFKNRNLSVLSISLDKDPEVVARFRAKIFAMPWRHAIPPEGDFHEGVKVLNPAGGTPQMLLVSPNGTIVATSEDLRGERLIPTLTKHLGIPDR